MEDCVVIRWKIRRDVKSTYATSFGVFASVIIVILFLWTIWSGFVVAEKPSMNNEYNNNSWEVCGGVLTIVLGLFFLAVGFPILADLCIKLFRQFRNPDESGIHQGSNTKTWFISFCHMVMSPYLFAAFVSSIYVIGSHS